MLKTANSHSFFIFGPRGVGKSHLVQHRYYNSKSLIIDLLNPHVEDRYRMQKDLLIQELKQKEYDWVLIDEVQKLPHLLDQVHWLIENRKQKFILTGSSARKLKRGGANLLAGRAFVYNLYPFTAEELGVEFDLNLALEWGLLPKIYSPDFAKYREEYLRAYALTYLKEEIQAEQIVRKIEPFRYFLQVAAQMSGKIINYSKIAKDVGVDTSTVQSYFSILEDTLIGCFLPSYHRSIRKRQRSSPKFYFFDTGVVRALAGHLSIPLLPSTSHYGDMFEHFLIWEIKKLVEYKRLDWQFSYLMTKDDVEIDLIIDRPGKKSICIEIKSSKKVTPSDLHSFIAITRDLNKSEAYCLSNDEKAQKADHVSCLHWRDGLKALGLLPK